MSANQWPVIRSQQMDLGVGGDKEVKKEMWDNHNGISTEINSRFSTEN